MFLIISQFPARTTRLDGTVSVELVPRDHSQTKLKQPVFAKMTSHTEGSSITVSLDVPHL